MRNDRTESRGRIPRTGVRRAVLHCRADIGDPGDRIDMDVVDRTEVEHHAFLHGDARQLVAAATHRKPHARRLRVANCILYVGDIGRLDDEPGMTRRLAAVPDQRQAGGGIAGFVRRDDRALDHLAQSIDVHSQTSRKWIC